MTTATNTQPTTDPGPVMPVVRRQDIEKAWTALGFKAFCGTYRNEKIGVVLKDFGAHQRGDVVLFEDHGDGFMNVGAPMAAAYLGGSGFITDVFSIVNVPRKFVSEIGPRDDMIKQTAK